MNIREIEEAIRHHNRLYWEEHAPVISDAEYDRLVEQLRSLDPSNPLLVRVEAPKISGGKVIHREPMLSLDKIYRTDGLFRWVRARLALTRRSFWCSRSTTAYRRNTKAASSPPEATDTWAAISLPDSR